MKVCAEGEKKLRRFSCHTATMLNVAEINHVDLNRLHFNARLARTSKNGLCA